MDGGLDSHSHQPSGRSIWGLCGLNFFLADVQTGLGPFLAIYLASFNWNQERVGLALTVGGFAGIIAQTPAGWLIDRLTAKRTLIAIAVAALAVGALVIAWMPRFWPVLAAQTVIGAVSSVFLPAVAAITLGLIGRSRFDRQQGVNQAFNSAGNVAAALAMGLIAYFVSNRAIFYYVAASCLPTLACLYLIDPRQIDHRLARGGADGNADAQPKAEGVLSLMRDRPLLVFCICCVLFHFANAAMLPLLGEMLSQGKGRASMLFMSACVVTTQLVISLISTPTGLLASRRGRKPLLLIGFAVLPVRGLLYVITHNTVALVAIQVLDGVGAGIFGVVSVLVIADLTKGTGRFNLAQGAIATAVGLGAALSQWIAGAIVHHAGYHTGFVFLSAIAAAALAVLWLFMPETLNDRLNQHAGRASEPLPAVADALR